MRDIGTVTVKVLTEPGHDGKAYVLTAPEALSHADVAAILSEATGKRFVCEDTSPEAYRRQLIAEGVTAFRADLVLNLFDPMRRRGAAPVSDDIAKVLGRPAIDFRQFARLRRRDREAGRVRATNCFDAETATPAAAPHCLPL
jgi:uncharacterized protein YbjT (DUF2867 family)